MLSAVSQSFISGRSGAKPVLWWAIVSAAAVILTLFILTAVLLRPARINALAVRALAVHMNLEASFQEISVALFPRPRISGKGVVLRIAGRPDLPPFIQIATFSADAGLLSAVRKHVDTVHLTGLKIAMPPGEARDQLGGTVNGNGKADGNPMSDVIIGHLTTSDAVLTFIPKDPAKTPLTFEIHDLDVNDIGFMRRMPFDARLTNPVPKGLVVAHGSIGPWQKDDPTRTPLEGAYTFSDADLATINGIGGILQSTGEFRGELTAIAADGEATVPDFSLDLGGKPTPLTAKFQTIVDGTDGTTTLKRVEARLANTPMVVTGAITNLPGPGNRQVDLEVQITDGQIEDLISLAIDAPQPLMRGDVSLTAKLSLPPGPARVRNRLRLAGKFGLSEAAFTDSDVQRRMEEFSRRGQGKDKDDPLARVVTSLRGQFTLASGVLGLPDLTFRVPGATILLRGQYALSTEAMNFVGTLRLQTSASRAIGGFKSIFVKPFDPLLRRNGAGAVIPIRIEGTRNAPKFSVRFGKIFSGG